MIIRVLFSFVAMALAAIPEGDDRELGPVYVEPDGHHVIVDFAKTFRGYDQDYARVYRGRLGGAFERLPVEEVRNMRGPPGMTITTDGHSLRLGFMGKPAPSFGAVPLTKVHVDDELRGTLARTEVRGGCAPLGVEPDKHSEP